MLVIKIKAKQNMCAFRLCLAVYNVHSTDPFSDTTTVLEIMTIFVYVDIITLS